MRRSNISDVSKKKSMLDDYQDKNAIAEVLGCLIKDPQLLKTYPLRMEDFVDVFHRTLFSVIHNMVRDDAVDIQPGIVEFYLKENYPTKYNMFVKHNGVKYMESVAEMASMENFKMNYNTVRKWSLLRELVQANIDVSEYFDPSDIAMDEEAEAKRDKFENDSLEMIMAFYKNKISQITNIFDQTGNRDKKKAGGQESINQVEIWKKSPDFGLSYASQLLTTVTYGLRRKRFTVVSAPSGTGKALPNDAVIPTPSGMRQVKDIYPGDYIFGADGSPTQVLQIHPQRNPKLVWQITFEDGRKVECCGEHLWEYWVPTLQGNKRKLDDTETIFWEYYGHLSKKRKNKNKLFVRLNGAVKWPKQSLRQDPYVLSLFLEKYSKGFPKEYLMGSIQQRYHLLVGLMDVNRCFDLNKKEVKLTVTTEPLCKDVLFLCHSLGLKADFSLTKDNKYKVVIYSSRRNIEYYISTGTRKNNIRYLAITDIECLNKYTDMTCFTVSAEDHLFLCNDFVVTHNTRLQIANMCFSYAPYYWDSKKGKWEPNQHGTENSALYIGTEMELLEEVEPIIWAYMADVPEDHITQNEYLPGEEERVKQAIEFLRQKDENGKEKNCGIYLEYVPEYDVDTLESIIEEYVTMHHVSAVFFDYIYSNPKLLAEYSAASKGNYAMRADQALSNLSTKLKDLTRRYNISIDTCTQVSGDYKNTDNYDESIVRGAKSIIDKCDIGIILTQPTDKEKTQIEPITRRAEMINKPMPNVCLTVYKNRGGRYSKVKIWLFVDYHTMRVHDLFATNRSYELIKIEKSRVVVDEDGAPHIFTNTDAMEQFKAGKITQNTLEQVELLEKEDPSYKKKTRNDEKLLKQAEIDVEDTSFGENGNLIVDDDFDAEDFDY